MGARSLETTLSVRLLVFIGPTLLVVGVAAFAITARALDVVDRDAARSRAESALRMLRAELDEGDDVLVAVREVVLAADTDGVRVVLRRREPLLERGGAHPVPLALRGMSAGSCGTADDELERPWSGCAVRDGEYDAVAAIPIDAHRTVLKRLATGMAAIVLLASLAIVAAARWALRRPLASLAALVGWSETLSVGDVAPHPPQPAAISEIVRLTGSFDALVGRLFEALARERANSAYIAHELRTPLTALRAELEALQPVAAEAVQRMLADLDRLARVIDAILVLSSPARGGGESPSVGVVNVADVVRELATDETVIEAPDEALVDAEARLVELAIVNLLENAVKYSGHAATGVRVSRREEQIEITVIDDGPGLAAEERARMFDLHWRSGARARASGADAGKGSGLGLALVRAVAERHGGSASARPNPRGRGLEVSLTIGPLLAWHDDAAVKESFSSTR